MANLRKLAEGRDCKLRLPGICNRDSSTVVLCHLKRGWCGSLKPPDIVGVWGCSACHDVIDRRVKSEFTEEQIDAMILVSLCEQLDTYVRERILRW
jgi:hypothetical protein